MTFTDKFSLPTDSYCKRKPTTLAEQLLLVAVISTSYAIGMQCVIINRHDLGETSQNKTETHVHQALNVGVTALRTSIFLRGGVRPGPCSRCDRTVSWGDGTRRRHVMSEWVRAFFSMTPQCAKVLTTLFQGFDTIASNDSDKLSVTRMRSAQNMHIKN